MRIELKAQDGHTFSAWKTGPADARRGLVVVQEIFGVNRHMRHVCENFAQQGYAVICPALFDRAERDAELGYTQEDVQRGLALRGKISEAQVMLDIEAAAAALPEGLPRGIVGYCWGGTIAWWGATRSRSFQAAVGYYGGGIAATRAETPHCPVQLHFGEQDKGIPLTDVEAIRTAQPRAEVFIYPGAGHGFACEERPVYSPTDAMLAEQRTLGFFQKHLT
ncbi:carboxymethylenebutenolidase [Acetobacteraceae bacterium AT-5844]|nr:carboxymethylenebutenolidase [Acetobacteraceae bacterium AT-5844]